MCSDSQHHTCQSRSRKLSVLWFPINSVQIKTSKTLTMMGTKAELLKRGRTYSIKTESIAFQPWFEFQVKFERDAAMPRDFNPFIMTTLQMKKESIVRKQRSELANTYAPSHLIKPSMNVCVGKSPYVQTLTLREASSTSRTCTTPASGTVSTPSLCRTPSTVFSRVYCEAWVWF
jgi:hypothetical protein